MSLKLQASLRRDLWVLWLAIAAVCLVLAALLVMLFQQGAGPQIARATHQAAVSCETLSAGAERVAAAHPGASATVSQQAVLDLALRDLPGTEGGFWRTGAGVTAYAFPTYDGTGVKRDPPSAELDRIAATAQRALDSASLVTDVRPGLREVVVFSACPVRGDPGGSIAWTLQRVPLVGTDVVNPLILGVSLLLCFVIVSGVWLARMLVRWRGQLAMLQSQLAQSERLATLGRVSAGLAHEIRNPLGTMRMKVENALAAPPETRETRMAGALDVVLTQSSRLESLVASLLALTQPFAAVHRQPVNLHAFLQERLQAHGPAADAAGVRLTCAVDPAIEEGQNAPGRAWFDPVQMARVFDNLLLNALAHTSHGGQVEVGAQRSSGGRLKLWVADDGAGVPAELRDTLFEAFATARTGGSGLGLALVREIVQAHGGRVALVGSAQGARIEMELPWPTS